MLASKPNIHDDTTDRQALIATNDNIVIRALNAAGTHRGWWINRDDWQRSYTCFHTEATGYCTLLFETQKSPQKLCLVIFTRHKPDAQLQGGAQFLDQLLGWMTIMPFYHDPVLTTLPFVLSGYADYQIVRYRPLRRCTLKAWHQKLGRDVYVKVFADTRGHTIFNNSRLLSDARKQQRLGFQVAEAIDWDAANKAVILGRVPGHPLTQQLFSQRGVHTAERMGMACGTLPGSGITPALKFDRHIQYQRTRRYADKLKQHIPGLASDINCFLKEVSDYTRTLPDKSLQPIHGAPHAHQWLDTGDQLGLIDFDRFCMGDPELDVATFVAEMDFEDPAQVPIEEINRGFIHQYEQQAGPLNHALVQLYRAQKRLAKALKAARSVRKGARSRATRHFKFATDCLNEVKL